ncbi:hypothetical protein [Nocardioides sp. T2.26MG-1]|uniref:hypothetical protein n=1 Tax=Nocardioides sp. T2.26MG-1 TaxID=3041166 RepID=UPI00247763DA|nr:hypothetical protein [Nocardioides sp. T2.26MG-1]CAI9417162.1 hypothetical protein HIDPHFAB_02951 [Nocardioides sp. T2.26MG-1]
MANKTRTYLLVEERLGKSLSRYVTAARRQTPKRSWNAIARELHEKTQVAVTSETVRLWFYEMEKDLESGPIAAKSA